MDQTPSHDSIPSAAQHAAETTPNANEARIKELETLLKAKDSALTAAIHRGDDFYRAFTEKKTELRKSQEENAQITLLLKRAESAIQAAHRDKHQTDGKIEAYENVLGLMVTGKPGMGERDKAPEMPPGLADLIERITRGPKTEH
jgi:chromosome segregation ATPase